jgi:hypothetical protein
VRPDAPGYGLGGRGTEAVLLRGHHLDELPPPGEDAAELLGLGVGKCPGGGPHGLGEAGQGFRVQPVGLGKLAGGTGEVPSLPGVEHADGDPGGGQGRGYRALEAAAGFEDHEGGVARPFEPAEELVEALLVVAHGEGFTRGQEGHIQAGLGDVDADVGSSARWAVQLHAPFALPASLGSPNLAGAGSEAMAPAQATVRAPPGVKEGRDDPGFLTASREPRRHRSVAPTPTDSRQKPKHKGGWCPLAGGNDFGTWIFILTPRGQNARR